jgi:hypothetical protein
VRELQNQGVVDALQRHWGQSLLGALLVVILTALMVRLRHSAAKPLLALSLLPMMLAWIGAAATGKAYNVRYALFGLVGFLGLVAIALCQVSHPRRWGLIALTAGIFLWADAQWFYEDRFWKEDSRSAVAWLRNHLHPGASVAVVPGYQVPVLHHYARREAANLVFLPLADSSSSLEQPLPGALLLTRLHHVPHWQDLVRSFEAGSPGSLSFGVVGYRGFLSHP